MRLVFLYAIILGTLMACSPGSDYNPDKQLSAIEKDEMLEKIIRYLAKPPENVSESKKFEKQFDAYYQTKISEARIEQYYRTGDDHYFLVSQVAPSVTVKRHATGGKFRLNDEGKIAAYEEIFRTWKMVPDTLKKRSYILFDKMVKGESLAPYYTASSNGVEYIEFPDERTYYDIESKSWKVK